MPQIRVFLRWRFSQHFRIFIRVAARLLHKVEHQQGMTAVYLDAYVSFDLY